MVVKFKQVIYTANTTHAAVSVTQGTQEFMRVYERACHED